MAALLSGRVKVLRDSTLKRKRIRNGTLASTNGAGVLDSQRVIVPNDQNGPVPRQDTPAQSLPMTLPVIAVANRLQSHLLLFRNGFRQCRTTRVISTVGLRCVSDSDGTLQRATTTFVATTCPTVSPSFSFRSLSPSVQIHCLLVISPFKFCSFLINCFNIIRNSGELFSEQA